MKILKPEKKNLLLPSWFAKLLPYAFLYYDIEYRSKMKHVPYKVEELINRIGPYKSIHIIRKQNDDPYGYCICVSDTQFVFIILTASFLIRHDKNLICKRLPNALTEHDTKHSCMISAYFIPSFDCDVSKLSPTLCISRTIK